MQPVAGGVRLPQSSVSEALASRWYGSHLDVWRQGWSSRGVPHSGIRLRCSAPTNGSVRAQAQSGGTAVSVKAEYKRILLPIIDKNPYLSESTRLAAATTMNLAKKYGAEITIVVIDDESKVSKDIHELRVKNIRWHLAEGGFEDYGLLEKLGEGQQPAAAVIAEIADDMGLDLVILSMETIHSKHIDGNLLAEFLPCPVLLVPL